MPEHTHLTDLEQLLLLSVLRLGQDAYGLAIQSDLEEVTGRSVSLGSIHMTMGRLEERGMARSEKGEPLRVRGGKARRMYEVTESGRSALEASRRTLERMWAGVPGARGA
jgi:DNA-binding PadR family transcriptional regulator